MHSHDRANSHHRTQQASRRMTHASTHINTHASTHRNAHLYSAEFLYQQVQILYEDELLICLHKPSRLSTTQTLDRHRPSLEGFVKAYLGREDIHFPHRLDVGTSGIVLVSKQAQTHKQVSQIFENRYALKVYWAICQQLPNFWDLPAKPTQVLTKTADMRSKSQVLSKASKAENPVIDWALMDQSVGLAQRELIRYQKILPYLSHPFLTNTQDWQWEKEIHLNLKALIKQAVTAEDLALIYSLIDDSTVKNELHQQLYDQLPCIPFRKIDHLKLLNQKPDRYGAVHSGGLKAITDFRYLQQYQQYHVIEARPKTGRTHQIRVHLSEAQAPILGDELYGHPASSLLPIQQVRHLSKNQPSATAQKNNASFAKQAQSEESMISASQSLMLKANMLIFPHPLETRWICLSAQTPCHQSKE